MATSIRRKMVYAAGATIFVFAAVTIAVYKTTRDLIAARIAVEASEAKVRIAANVERLFDDLAMSEHAFVICGEEQLFAPYEKARAEIDAAIEQLATAVADEPEQAARIQKVGALVARWRSETAEPVIAAKKAAIAAAAGGSSPPALRPEDLVRQDAGNFKVKEVRRELDGFREAELKVGESLRAFAEESAHVAVIVAIGGGALAIAVAALSAWMVVRGVTRPLAELVQAAQRIEAGHFDERVPVRARDEVGLLAEAFNCMAESVSASRRDVEERARTLQAVLDHVDVGIALFDTQGKLQLTNGRLPKVLDVAGFELEEAGGLLPWLRARAVNPQQVESWQQQITKNPNCLIFETIELGPPRNLVIRVYGGPVPAAPPTAASFFAPGAPKAADHAGARILVLRDATREAEADRVKAEFISTVSHELRTPLTSVRGYVDLVLGGDAGPISGEQREFLEIVARNTERLSALINDLLDVEKLQAGKIVLKRDPVDLPAVLESVVKTFKVMAQSKGLALEAQLDPVPAVLGDADRLTQVFANLVSNAIKYTQEGAVLVRAHKLQDEIRVEVRDTGIGLTPEERSRVFEKFFRADNTYTRAAGGTGLGLTIAKAIVERHGARIEVTSEAGKGSIFAVMFPASREARPAAAAPAPAEARV